MRHYFNDVEVAKILKNNLNLNIYSYFNILHFLYFLNNYLNLWLKNSSPKRQKAVLFTQQAGGDLKNIEKHFYFLEKKNF